MPNKKQKFIVEQTDKEALKIHGYIFENPTDSDSGKVNLGNNSHKQKSRQQHYINPQKSEMNNSMNNKVNSRHKSKQKPRQQHYKNIRRGDMNKKMLSKANENKYANKQTGSFIPSKTYISSSTTVDPPTLNTDQRFGTNSNIHRKMSNKKQEHIVEQTDKEALRIHGYIFENPTDSDSGKSEFDEEYYKNKPPPIHIDPSQIICVKNLANNSHKQKSRQQHYINPHRGEINKMASTADENKYANKQTGTFIPSKTYFGSSTAVDPPTLNTDQRFGTKSETKANYIQPNESIFTIPKNSAPKQAKRSSTIFFTEEKRYQLDTTNAFISEYNRQANINNDSKENKDKIKSILKVHAEYASLNIPQKVSSNSSRTYTEPSIHTANVDPKLRTDTNITAKGTARTSVKTNSIQPSPEMYCTPNTSTSIFTITDNSASTANNSAYLPTKSLQDTRKTSGSPKVTARSVSDYKNRQANGYENAAFDEVRTEMPNVLKENLPGAYCSQVDAEEEETIVDNHVVADETDLFDESEENHCNCCTIL